MRRGVLVATIGFVTACGGQDTAPEPTKQNLGHRPKSGPPAHVVGGFSIQLPDFELEPGAEEFPCWIFPLEVEGPSRIVGGGKIVTGPGMHHGNITTRPKTGEGIRPCSPEDATGELGSEVEDVLAGGSVLFGSSTQLVGEEWQSFPDGMGYPVVDDYEIVARMHYLNATPEPVTVAPRYEWFTIDEEKVDHVLGPFAWVLSGWEIPPLSTFSYDSGDCDVPGPMQVVNVLPHMHELGTELFASYYGGERHGQRWLDSKGYDPENGVMTQYTPAVDLSQGYGARFGCTWENRHDKVIVEGVGDNEMCIIFGYAYPYEHAYSATSNGNGCLMVAPPPPGSGG